MQRLHSWYALARCSLQPLWWVRAGFLSTACQQQPCPMRMCSWHPTCCALAGVASQLCGQHTPTCATMLETFVNTLCATTSVRPMGCAASQTARTCHASKLLHSFQHRGIQFVQVSSRISSRRPHLHSAQGGTECTWCNCTVHTSAPQPICWAVAAAKQPGCVPCLM
jgi:hypothetical protein